MAPIAIAITIGNTANSIVLVLKSFPPSNGWMAVAVDAPGRLGALASAD